VDPDALHRAPDPARPAVPADGDHGAALSERWSGVALVVAAVASLQFGAGFAVTLFDELGPAGAAFVRLAFAAAVLLAIWRPRLGGHPRADLRVALLFGLVLGLMNLSIYSAMDRIPLGVAVTIEFAGPLTVAVAGSRRPLDLLWVTLAAAGILLLAEPGGDSDLDAVGVMFALLAAAMWAAYIVLSARTGRLFPGGSGLAIAMAVGAVVALPFGVAQGGRALLEPGLLAAGAAVALVSSVIPYSLELEALRRLPARVFGVLMSLEPAMAALAGLVVLGQALAVREWLAVALVVAASAGAAALHR
jgi:inner membrane transporter RhtA